MYMIYLFINVICVSMYKEFSVVLFTLLYIIQKVTNMPFHVMNRRQTHSMETRNIHLQTLQSFQDRRYELQIRIQSVDNFMGRKGDNYYPAQYAAQGVM